MTHWFRFTMLSVALVTMCLVSIGAIEFWGRPDPIARVFLPLFFVWATWAAHKAIAMETRRAETGNTDSVAKP